MDAVTLALARNSVSALEKQLFETKRVTVTWDGNTEGRTVVWEKDRNDRGWCYVSGLIPDLDKLSTATITTNDGKTTPFKADGFEKIGVDYGYYVYIVFVYRENTIVEPVNTNFPNAGIYFGFNLLGQNEYPAAMSFDIKQIQNTTVFNLDEMGIDVQSLVLAGGGGAEIDASAIWGNIVRGGSYIFRGSFAGTSMDILPSFYQWNADGSLECIGFAIAGNVSGFVQVHYVMQRDYLSVVITPLGA